MPLPPLLFFDAETGGIDPARHDMLEVGCILTDPSGKTVLSEYSTKILPTRPVDPDAARVNGYDPMRWSVEAVDLKTALSHILAMGRSAAFVAHNAPFDADFMRASVGREKLHWSPYFRLDTLTLALPLRHAGKVPNLRLATLAEYFGLAYKDTHTALSDARICREVFLELMALYSKIVVK